MEDEVVSNQAVHTQEVAANQETWKWSKHLPFPLYSIGTSAMSLEPDSRFGPLRVLHI